MKKTIFKGVATAVITPFSNGAVDYVSFINIFEKQIKAGVDAIVVLGTTGEPCTITQDERERIIKFAVDFLKDKTKVIIGCGANNTNQAIDNYKRAEKLGADGALIVTPYYNKCTQGGLIEHYKEIAEHGDLPIIAYNVPSRTGVNILPQTMKEISKIKNICGIKEASGNIVQILEYFRLIGNEIDIYSGDDSLNGLFLMLGGSGCISVLSNVVPKLAKKINKLYLEKKLEEANNLSFRLLPLINALFSEVNPIPVKASLEYLGLCKNELRLPLTKISETNYETLKKEINKVWADEYDCL